MADVIAERSPIDFVAYILAIGDLGRGDLAVGVLERAIAMARQGANLLDRIAFCLCSAGKASSHLNLKTSYSE